MNHFEETEMLLAADNWKLTRVCGESYQYQKAGRPATLTIPNCSLAPLPPAFLRHLEKATGLSLLGSSRGFFINNIANLLTQF